MNIVLFDTAQRDLLFPFTLTRPVAAIRYGIFTNQERWQQYFDQPIYYLTEKYLAEKFPVAGFGDNLYINASWIIDPKLVRQIKDLPMGASVWSGEILVAGRSDQNIITYTDLAKKIFSKATDIGKVARFIIHPWDMLTHNADAIKNDFESIRRNSTIQTIASSDKTISPENIFIEEGAIIENCILNASEGPIYIGKNCLVMDGSIIRGPFAMNEGSVLKMGSKIYGATSLGPYCTLGGEVKNSILFGYSNKAHDGYIGDSVIGEWCNLGAGTSASNVKNTAGDIKVWQPALKRYGNAGKKCGLFMGDHSRAAINTSFNSGTVTEVCCNVFGAGLTPKHIRSFSWGMNEDSLYIYEKAVTDCNNWMEFKKRTLSDADKKILKHIFDNR